MKPLPQKNMTLAELDAYLAARRLAAEQPAWLNHGSFPGIELDDLFGLTSSTPPQPPRPWSEGTKLGVWLVFANLVVVILFIVGATTAAFVCLTLWVVLPVVGYKVSKFWKQFKKELIEVLKEAK